MDPDSKLSRNAARNAWLAAMAMASGQPGRAEDFMAAMIVALGLTFPADVEIVYDADRMDRLHGASGSW
jgi:hypothetical protein